VFFVSGYREGRGDIHGGELYIKWNENSKTSGEIANG